MLFLASLLVQAGCVQRATRPLVAVDTLQAERWMGERESALVERMQFVLAGRIAISDGKDGGSGRFEWEQQARSFSLQFNAAMGAQSWRLDSQPGQALLIEGNGAVRIADSAEALLLRELRWHLPADALRFWVLGMRAPGSESELQFSADGELGLLRQSGWEVRYLDFDRSQTPSLPTRLYARSGEHQVRISVRSWRFP